MTAEELEATYKVCERKKQYLRSKIEPGKPIPAWIKEQLKFIESVENLAQMYYLKSLEYQKLHGAYTRLVELFQVLERAFFGFIPFRHCFQWYRETIGHKSIHTLTLMNLLSLLPETDNETRNSLISMINEHITGTIPTEGIRSRIQAAV